MKIRARHENNLLYFDFHYLGIRCREQTLLPDTKSNRNKLETIMKRIDAEIQLGTFDYGRYFPTGSRLDEIRKKERQIKARARKTPLFADFAETWFSEMELTWRIRTAHTYRRYLELRILPYFGEKEVSEITKADILEFRSETAKSSNGTLKAKTINKFVKFLGMILNEAADRFDFTSPYKNIKPLKEDKVHIEPFSIDEVNTLIANAPARWRDYILVRFFTGMRTGEIDGLKWKYVDFERREILVRETFSNGVVDYTKNDSSQREITMSTLVLETLKSRKEELNPSAEDYIFHLRSGNPIDTGNFLARVWKPLLQKCEMKYRRPYETRHTAATLWLAAGENPTWIAKQMGHTTTTMLFTVYARYVPNLTRSDGSAMERLLRGTINISPELLVKNPLAELSKNQEETDVAAIAKEVNFWDNILSDTHTHQ